MHMHQKVTELRKALAAASRVPFPLCSGTSFVWCASLPARHPVRRNHLTGENRLTHTQTVDDCLDRWCLRLWYGHVPPFYLDPSSPVPPPPYHLATVNRNNCATVSIGYACADRFEVTVAVQAIITTQQLTPFVCVCVFLITPSPRVHPSSVVCVFLLLCLLVESSRIISFARQGLSNTCSVVPFGKNGWRKWW